MYVLNVLFISFTDPSHVGLPPPRHHVSCVFVHACMYVCIYVCVCTYVCTVHVYMYIRMCVCACMCVWCVYISICKLCMHVSVNVHTQVSCIAKASAGHAVRLRPCYKLENLLRTVHVCAMFLGCLNVIANANSNM